MPAAAIQPENILHQLDELWTKLALPEHGASTASGVLRACAMTLIVAAEDTADAQQASETLAELMHEHPSRAIVLKPNQGDELEARVFAQCWMPFGGRQQICCEQIEITAGPERLGAVPGLMLALVAPDLPVVLWCRGERWFTQPHFDQMLPLVNKLIIDSCRFADAAKAFKLIGELMAGGRSMADLAWGRITGWRDIIARAFGSPASQTTACSAKSVSITHAGAAPSPEVYYLAAWLKRAMPDAAFSLTPSGDSAGSGIRSVSFDHCAFTLRHANTVEVSGAGPLRMTVLPESSDCHVMRAELAIAGRDTIYEQVQPIAAGLVQGR